MYHYRPEPLVISHSKQNEQQGALFPFCPLGRFLFITVLQGYPIVELESCHCPLWEVPKYCARPQITDLRVFLPLIQLIVGSLTWHHRRGLGERCLYSRSPWAVGPSPWATHLCLQGQPSPISYIPLPSGGGALQCLPRFMTWWVRHTQFIMGSSLLHGNLVVHGQVFSVYLSPVASQKLFLEKSVVIHRALLQNPNSLCSDLPMTGFPSLQQHHHQMCWAIWPRSQSRLLYSSLNLWQRLLLFHAWLKTAVFYSSGKWLGVAHQNMKFH